MGLLAALLRTTDKPLGRLHALYSLHGLDALAERHLRLGLGDDHPRVRAHAIRLTESLLDKRPGLVDDLARLSRDSSEHVRFQLAFTLGQSNDAKAVAALARLARNPNNSREVTTALLSWGSGKQENLIRLLPVAR